MIERGAQAVDVGPNVHVVAVHPLLGRDVIGCAQDTFVIEIARQLVLFDVGKEPRQPQVENLDRAMLIAE